jgi:RecJ-like exonuclease
MSLIKYALITFLIGLILLFFLSQSIEPKLIKIADINSKMMDNYVKIQGEVVKSKQSSGITILTIKDSTESITAVSYQPLNASGNVEILGKVTDYKGSLEIEIETLKPLT